MNTYCPSSVDNKCVLLLLTRVEVSSVTGLKKPFGITLQESILALSHFVKCSAHSHAFVEIVGFSISKVKES